MKNGQQGIAFGGCFPLEGRFFLDSLSIDLGPRPSGQHYYYSVEMCSQNTEENGQHQSFL